LPRASSEKMEAHLGRGGGRVRVRGGGGVRVRARGRGRVRGWGAHGWSCGARA